MDYNQLKAAIAAVIKQNGNQEITGDLLQSTLLTMVNSLGVGSQCLGVLTQATMPIQTDSKVFYLAGEGTYSNFGVTVPKGSIGIVFNSEGGWSVQTVSVPPTGYTAYGDIFYDDDDLPAKPTDGGLYFIYAQKRQSGFGYREVYRFVYTSNPAVNSGAWTLAGNMGQWSMDINESYPDKRSDPLAITKEGVAREIRIFFQNLNWHFNGTFPSSFSGTMQDAIDADIFQDEQEFNEFCAFAFSLYPCSITFYYDGRWSTLWKQNKEEIQGAEKVLFGGFVIQNYGLQVLFEINREQGDEAISWRIYEV